MHRLRMPVIFTYKVLTAAQPSQFTTGMTSSLFNLEPLSCRLSSLVTLAHPSTSSSLQITDRSIRRFTFPLQGPTPCFSQSTLSQSLSFSHSHLTPLTSSSSVHSPLPSSIHNFLITFRVGHSRGEMYIGHCRLCVCLSLAAFLYTARIPM